MTWRSLPPHDSQGLGHCDPPAPGILWRFPADKEGVGKLETAISQTPAMPGLGQVTSTGIAARVS